MLTPEQQEAMQVLREKRALLPDELPVYSDPRLARQLWGEALAAIDEFLFPGAYGEQPPPDAGDSSPEGGVS